MADIHGLKPNVRPNTPYNVTAQIRGDIRQIVRQEIEQIAVETIGAETPAGAQAKVDASALSLTAAIAAAKAELQLADDAKAALVHTHDDRYYLKAQVDSVLAGKASSSHAHDDRYYTEGEVDAAIATRAPASHNHNDQYYTEAEVDMALAGKAESSHTHPGVYYTVAQADALLATKAPLSHNHNMLYYSISQIDTALAGKADLVHDHNDRYYTEAEIDLMLTGLGGGGGDGWTPVTATTTTQGIVELATNSETTTGMDGTRAVTPAGVKAALDAKALSDMSTYVAQPAAGDDAGLAPISDGAGGYSWQPGGADGREIELQTSATHVQWRYVGDVAWTDLIALTAITGADGNDGDDGLSVELQTTATHIQWRLVGGAWADLVALSTITGPSGADGEDGADADTSGQFAVNTVASSGAAETLPATHAAHKVTMSENCTFTFTSPTAGHAFVLWLYGAFTPTWPASVDWVGGVAPTYAGAGTAYHFATLDAGTTWVGSGQAFS